MENKTKVLYRTYGGSIGPRKIKIEIPGFAGESNDHGNGSKAQPFHCLPFVDGSTYGLELIYHFETTTIVKNIKGKIVFEGDWSKEKLTAKYSNIPPFGLFADGHYGFTSSLDIQPPPDHIIRVEPHPSFYTDTTWSTPCAVPGHIQGEFWSSIFFVVFKSPLEGQQQIFQKGRPYAQIFILPKKVAYDIEEMPAAIKSKREKRNDIVFNNRRKIAKNVWKDNLNQEFDDKYKQLKMIFEKKGIEGVDEFLDKIVACPVIKGKLRYKLVNYKKLNKTKKGVK
jgi:hypothetical protein